MVVLVLAIAGGAFYIVQSLKPHEYDIMFDIGGQNSNGAVQYGLDDNLKTLEGAGSSGNWGSQPHEKFTGNSRRATLIYNITSLNGFAECTIFQDGKALDSPSEFKEEAARAN